VGDTSKELSAEFPLLLKNSIKPAGQFTFGVPTGALNGPIGIGFGSPQGMAAFGAGLQLITPTATTTALDPTFSWKVDVPDPSDIVRTNLFVSTHAAGDGLFPWDRWPAIQALEGSANGVQALASQGLSLTDQITIPNHSFADGQEVHLDTNGCLPGSAGADQYCQERGVQPGTDYSDYQEVARRLMSVHRKRALVILLTNFRDEDAAELRPALRLLRTRHLVLLASLRERAHRQILQGASTRHEQAVLVAGSHLFEQARRDAFLRLVGNDPLAIDVEPAGLAVALVNHYHAVKKARLL